MPTNTDEAKIAQTTPESPITRGLWSEQEHEQFLNAMKMFPTGPWRSIAALIGTRSIKQVQTHAQKYQQKINRRRRGLRKMKKKFVRPEHRVDSQATGCIQRVRNVRNLAKQSSPRSPSAFPISDLSHLNGIFGPLLMGACSPVASETGSSVSSSSSFDLDTETDASVIRNVEPLSFEADVTHEELLDDDAYRQDVQESLDLLLS